MSTMGARWAIGTAVLGRPAYINTGPHPAPPESRTVDAMRENLFRVLDAASSAGVDWIDTARSYGRAEEFVGQWVRSRRPDPAPFVSSKWGYAYVGEWRVDADVHEVKEHSLPQLERQWGHTGEALGGAVDLYQVHSLTLDSPLFEDRELLVGLHRLRVERAVQLGFSTSGPHQAETVRRALELSVDGEPLFVAVQSTWNLLETSVGPALAEAHERGLTVLVKEALANGRLVTDAPAPLRELADGLGVGRDAIALAAAAAQPWADRVLLGPASVDHLTSNLRADAVTPTQVSGLDLAEPADTYWQERSRLTWG